MIRSGNTKISKINDTYNSLIFGQIKEKRFFLISINLFKIKIDGIEDNWDLSVKRATSVVRILQNDYNVSPERMTAAGRSYYIPLMDNDNASNRARNRRTRIVVLPKLDQFYDLIQQGMN